MEFDFPVIEGVFLDIEVYVGRKTCFQKIQKEKQRVNEKITSFDKDTAIVREISYREAKALILKYEWLGTMPSAPFKQYGLFLNGFLVAVECFQIHKSGNSKFSFLKKPAVCLARGASIGNAPKWVGSYLISKALKLLSESLDNKPYFILAYADWEAGELGHIYQACSWVYSGHWKSMEWRSPEGLRKDSSYHRQITRRIDPEYKTKRKINPDLVKESKKRLLSEGWTLAYTLRGRYVTLIGENGKEKREMKRMLKAISKPYLKNHVDIG